MTVNQFMNTLISGATEQWAVTCDKLIAGNGERDVHKICTCFKATAEVIDKAWQRRCDLLIAHEPVFYGNESRSDSSDPVTSHKWELIDQSGVSIFRFHDHAHLYDPDFIHDGFIRAVGLEIESRHPLESLGIRRYVLSKPIALIALADNIANVLNVPHVRIVGDASIGVKTVCLGLGSVGVGNIRVLTASDADLFITGEIDEVHGCEYIRDAAYFGMKKAMLLLGHCSAEYAGMRLLADYISARFPEIETEYLHCGEVCI